MDILLYCPLLKRVKICLITIIIIIYVLRTVIKDK